MTESCGSLGDDCAGLEGRRGEAADSGAAKKKPATVRFAQSPSVWVNDSHDYGILKEMSINQRLGGYSLGPGAVRETLELGPSESLFSKTTVS